MPRCAAALALGKRESREQTNKDAGTMSCADIYLQEKDDNYKASGVSHYADCSNVVALDHVELFSHKQNKVLNKTARLNII